MAVKTRRSGETGHVLLCSGDAAVDDVIRAAFAVSSGSRRVKERWK